MNRAERRKRGIRNKKTKVDSIDEQMESLGRAMMAQVKETQRKRDDKLGHMIYFHQDKRPFITLQQVLDIPEVQEYLDKRIRNTWEGVPQNFKPSFNLDNPFGPQDSTKITLKGVNNSSNEEITLADLNFLYLYYFVSMVFNVRNTIELSLPENTRDILFAEGSGGFSRSNIEATVLMASVLSRLEKDWFSSYVIKVHPAEVSRYWDQYLTAKMKHDEENEAVFYALLN